jgi:hypothetical protein
MKTFLKIAACLAGLTALAGCGTYGAGVNTPIGGAGAGVTIGTPGPAYGPPSYLR